MCHLNSECFVARRFLTVKIEGRTYQIPEMWLVGFRGTTVEAIRWWHQQELMGEQFEAQRAKAAA